MGKSSILAPRRAAGSNFYLAGRKLEKVNKTNYLGMLVNFKGVISADTQSRHRAARDRCSQLRLTSIDCSGLIPKKYLDKAPSFPEEVTQSTMEDSVTTIPETQTHIQGGTQSEENMDINGRGNSSTTTANVETQEERLREGNTEEKEKELATIEKLREELAEAVEAEDAAGRIIRARESELVELKEDIQKEKKEREVVEKKREKDKSEHNREMLAMKRRLKRMEETLQSLKEEEKRSRTAEGMDLEIARREIQQSNPGSTVESNGYCKN